MNEQSRPRLLAAISVSIALGIVWCFVPVLLMGGKPKDALAAYWLIPGALAGLAAGLFTIRRSPASWKKSLIDTIATYYLGIAVFWMGFVVIERILMCIRQGGWTDFNLSDHFKLILLFLAYGTIPYGLILIPLCFLSRTLLLKTYRRRSHE